MDQRIVSAGESREIALVVDSAGLKAADLRVEVIISLQDVQNGHKNMKIFPMGLVAEPENNKLEYRTNITADKDGTYRFNCRVIPTHTDLYNNFETHLIKWLD